MAIPTRKCSRRLSDVVSLSQSNVDMVRTNDAVDAGLGDISAPRNQCRVPSKATFAILLLELQAASVDPRSITLFSVHALIAPAASAVTSNDGCLLDAPTRLQVSSYLIFHAPAQLRWRVAVLFANNG